MVSVDVDMCSSLPASCFQLPALIGFCFRLLSRRLPRSSAGSERQVAGGGLRHTLNLVPHPHVLFAFGLLKMKPRLTRLVSEAGGAPEIKRWRDGYVQRY